MAIPGNSVIHQALKITVFPSYNKFPQLGSGAGIPAPKKLSAASIMMESAKMKVAWTISGDKTFVAMFNQIMRDALAPAPLKLPHRFVPLLPMQQSEPFGLQKE